MEMSWLKRAYRSEQWAVFLQMVESLQQDVYDRTVHIFGEKWNHPQERGLRLLEEVCEAVQALDISREYAHRIVDGVYDRPKESDIRKELGSSFMLLLGLAQVTGHNLAVCYELDAQMVSHPDKQAKMRARQSEKLHPEGF
jgi:NTP pyrophosphatase (non-canonical NTP hydrolase)